MGARVCDWTRKLDRFAVEGHRSHHEERDGFLSVPAQCRLVTVAGQLRKRRVRPLPRNSHSTCRTQSSRESFSFSQSRRALPSDSAGDGKFAPGSEGNRRQVRRKNVSKSYPGRTSFFAERPWRRSCRSSRLETWTPESEVQDSSVAGPAGQWGATWPAVCLFNGRICRCRRSVVVKFD